MAVHMPVLCHTRLSVNQTSLLSTPLSLSTIVGHHFGRCSSKVDVIISPVGLGRTKFGRGARRARGVRPMH
eukprot:scaffold7295_cov65-Cyclotella_meneghiniana.AAC.2